MADPVSPTTKYPSGDRWICSASHPWRPGLPTPVVHPGASEVSSRDGYPCGDIASMKCAVCGTEWEMELPQ